MKKINLRVVAPEKEILKGQVEKIILPTTEGQITILPNHQPMITALKAGEVIIQKEKEIIPLAISGGLLKIDEKEVIVLADTAERAEEIDEKRAQEAKERAEKLLKEKQLTSKEIAMALSKIEKELVRLKVAKKWKKLKKPS